MNGIVVLIISLVVIGALALFFYFMWRKNVNEFIPANVTNLKYDPKAKILFFNGGVTGKPYMARGNCTVWHSMSGKRFDVFMESKLYDIWDYWEYNNKNK